MGTLYEQLASYHDKDIYPMHMPGHKRNLSMMRECNAYAMDITEIDGFDNLHDAEGIIKDSLISTAKLYHCDQSYFLVNGSTVGLLAGILAATNKRDQVLVARNCHKAVYNALYLNELEPIYIYPEFNEEVGCYEEVTTHAVKEALEANPNIKLIIITSPTYEGVISKIDEIVGLSHAKNIPVLVDEAHGAHLPFAKDFGPSGISMGADLVIHSVHKTLPCFTQTALLHKNGILIDERKLEMYLQMLQTSSPSYLFMSSIDRCMTLLEGQGEELFASYKKELNNFYEQAEKLNYLSLYKVPKNKGIQRDPSKIVISVKNTTITAMELYQRLLKEYKIQMEMVSKDYVLAMTSICDTKEGYERLLHALLEIDGTLERSLECDPVVNIYHIPKLEQVMTSYEALQCSYEMTPITKANGKISAEYVYLYPPGIPIVVPGEKITTELLKGLEECEEAGLSIKGLKDPYKCNILTIV